MQVRRLSDVGGIEVEGVDLSRQQSPEENRAIAGLYNEHGLVVFRDQRLTKQQLVHAADFFGGAMIDPPATTRDPDVPGITVISTRGATGDLVPPNPDEIIGDIDWHTDQGYVTAPNRGKIMYAVEVPEVGGKTGFIDGQVTYNSLSEELRRRIEGLHVIQSWNRAESDRKRNRTYRTDGEKLIVNNAFPDIAYLIAYDHPITGAKVLNVPPLWSAGIMEMRDPEGDALLEELKAHILQPQFQYWHSYRVGDALIWDNWRSIHAASGTPGQYRRTLWQVVIKEGPQLGNPLPAVDTLVRP
jgi:taurine dioxygenase